MIIGYKNKYNTTIKQIKINFEDKTFIVGNISIFNDIILSRKMFDLIYNILKRLEIKEVL